MAKAKGPTASVQNRHIYTRASYLYQAANYLANLSQEPRNAPPPPPSKPETSRGRPSSSSSSSSSSSLNDKTRTSLINTSRHIISDMRSVTLKTQIRCTPAMKRSICKFCDTLLIEGKTCDSVVENASKSGRKPWADVLVIRCGTCGHVKRFPVGDERRKGRAPIVKMEKLAEDAQKEEVKDSS